MNSKRLSDRQLFVLELEQLKTIEVLENEEMWAQRVIDEAPSSSTKNADLNAARDSSESGGKPSCISTSGYARYQCSESLGSEGSGKKNFVAKNMMKIQRRTQRILSVVIAFLLHAFFSLSVSAQQTNPKNLPLCPEDQKEFFHDCWGARYHVADGNYVGEFRNNKKHGFGTLSFAKGSKYTGQFKEDKWHGEGVVTTVDGKRLEGVWENDNFIRMTSLGSRLDNATTRSDRADIERERQQLAEERRRLEAEKRQREQQRQSQRINLKVTNTQPDADGAVTINVQTNADTASLLINNEEQGGRSDGSYTIKKVARIGKDTEFTITATDINGNSDTKIITVTRQTVPTQTTQAAILKPETISRSQPRDAVAIIIGIQNYKRVPNADFANNDAREFSEYAIRALGIKPEKIKILLDDEADEVNIVKAFENWLPIQVNKDKTEVYVFYSGHGLPSSDGKSLYFLPHGVDKELLSRTAVAQNDIIAALTAAKPKSVTMFIDACYSGQTRGGDVLVANAKPVALKADKNAYPANFTVITASANDQISSSSPELKHGIFSFYLMKGMEGDADANQDGKITVGEMQDYLSDKVYRQAMTLNRKQNTQLVGDSNRVLVAR